MDHRQPVSIGDSAGVPISRQFRRLGRKTESVEFAERENAPSRKVLENRPLVYGLPDCLRLLHLRDDALPRTLFPLRS